MTNEIEHIDSLFDRYKKLAPLIEEFLQKVYEQEGLEETELAIMFHLLSQKNLHKAIKQYSELTDIDLASLSAIAVSDHTMQQEEAPESLTILLNKHSTVYGLLLTTFDSLTKAHIEEELDNDGNGTRINGTTEEDSSS